jgi:DNA mismatch repair protein MutS
MSELPDVISLLWPNADHPTTRSNWHPNSIADLGLDAIISGFNFDGRHGEAIKNILLTLCNDPETIRYRQEILDDFLGTPDLIQRFEEILPLLSDLAYYGDMSEMQGLPFQKTLSRMGELELYVQTVEKLGNFLRGSSLKSQGLRNLLTLLDHRLQDPVFKQMQKELPGITAKFRDLQSITIGVNLDHNLKPIAATILSINTEPFKGASFFKKLFGDRDEFQGSSQLHTVPMKTTATSDGRLLATQQRADPLMFPLFKDLDTLITDIVRPIAAELKAFLRVSTQFLATLEPEIVFYLGAIRLINQIKDRGLPMCRAEIADVEDRLCVIHDCYNLNLALRTLYRNRDSELAGQVVGNDVKFDETGRIFIITGPNQGGKTTYIQAIAIAQVLFQAGLPVPGSQARISPVDGIYTHFPVEEKPNAEAGRFGEEAQRLNEIFSQATRHSLVLLNESLSSTAAGESFYLARDIVRCLRLLGARAAYTTHMHELAASADELNTLNPGDSKVMSLVAIAQPESNAGSEEGIKRTYKIISSPPMGRSYANELAARYGISFDKIVETLNARQVIAPQTTGESYTN